METGVTLFLEEKFQRGRQGLLPCPPSHRKWQKKCMNICKHILKFSNCVLVRGPINNNNYEQPMVLFIIILAKNSFRNHHGCKESPCWCQLININKGGAWKRPFAVANCVLNEVYLSTMVGQGEATYFICSY